MQANSNSRPATCRLLCLIGAATLALSVGTASAAEPRSTYEQERAACMSGKSHQDRATCLREAAAARDEARRGNLNDRGTAYEQNALARCEKLPVADREDCHRRIKGDGTSSGSVETGGILREVVTPIYPDGTPVRQGTPASPAQ